MTDTGRLRAALLRLLRETLGVARERRLPASVCGEAASDELLACVLVGFGATGLSDAGAARAAAAAALEIQPRGRVAA